MPASMASMHREIPSSQDLTGQVLRLGRIEGLDAMGVAKADPFLGTRQVLAERKQVGLHAGMHFTYGDPERADAPLMPAAAPVEDGCGACRQCLPACPTGALITPGVLDARRCLAWLLEVPGSFPLEYREALGGRVYGCDDCQEVCPPNRVNDRRNPPPPSHSGDEAAVDLVELLEANDDELLDRFGRWYIPRRQARFLRRNALVVVGNVADGSDPRVATVLAAYLSDADPMLREHAAWAAGRLGRADLVEASTPA